MKKLITKSSSPGTTTPKKAATKAKSQKKAVKKSVPAKDPSPKVEPLDNAIAEYIGQLTKDKDALLPSSDIGLVIAQFCDKFGDLKKKEISNPDQVLENLKQLASSFGQQINFQENSIGETVVKYRIKQGRLFLIMKKVVIASKKKWGTWFKDSFSVKEYRSAQEYMQLSKKPNIENYAVLGKDRLLKILRTDKVKGKSLDDPIGTFIKSKKIEFDPKADSNLEELKLKVDVEINLERLAKEGFKGIPRDKVEKLIKTGQQITGQHIKELSFHKSDNRALVKCLDEIIANGGRAVAKDTPERKAESFSWTADRFIKALEKVPSDDQFFSIVKLDTLQALKEKIAELEERFASRTEQKSAA